MRLCNRRERPVPRKGKASSCVIFESGERSQQMLKWWVSSGEGGRLFLGSKWMVGGVDVVRVDGIAKKRGCTTGVEDVDGWGVESRRKRSI
jgi:hypothetical protein